MRHPRQLLLAVAGVLLATGWAIPSGGVVSAAPVTCGVPAGSAAAIQLSPGQSSTVTGALGDTRYVCLSGAPAHLGVLDVSATAPPGTDLLLCANGVPDPANPGTTTLTGRSSHVGGSPSQRVAFSNPRFSEYAVALH
ncbi:MAG: hypothetical protein M3010_07000, partial [Candidatus Dormibacteraeota bacterium]|nr:hypothetical protein [Candidatus Dormibacteraeota bacterium]